MKKVKISLFLILISIITFSQNRIKENKIKNIILMIPDGTSIEFLTLARWYNDNKANCLDSLICGLVQTHCADNRFPDSAPAGTAYATAHKSCKKHVGIDCKEIPHISVLEYAKFLKKSTGIVVTCEFTNATPAAFVCHHNDRNDTEILAKQFIYNSPDILFAGGKSIIEKYNLYNLMTDLNIELITDKTTFFNKTSLKNGTKIWGLFSDWKNNNEYKSYEIDRPSNEPSLSEMTSKAIELLSQNENGFFLMIEGSQIDWACHDNDISAAIMDFIEFDKAVNVAINFAKKNKNTIVIIVPDHGNGGISIGNKYANTGINWKNNKIYNEINITEDIIKPLKKIKCSSRKMSELISRNKNYLNTDTLKKYLNITKNTEILIKEISNIMDNNELPNKSKIDSIKLKLGRHLSDEIFIGWTTTGHTAEDVFLAMYSPIKKYKISGVFDNYEIGKLIFDILNENSSNNPKDTIYYVNFRELFKEKDIVSIDATKLIVNENNSTVEYYSNSNIKKFPSTNKEEILKGIIITTRNQKGEIIYYLPVVKKL